MSEALDRVARSAAQLAGARARLEEQLKRELEVKLAELSTALDIAAAEAYRSGEKKSRIGLAMKTTDYKTYNTRIERGEEILGRPTLDEEEKPVSPYSFEQTDNDMLLVSDGTFEAYAQFEQDRFDGKYIFVVSTPLWDGDIMNPLVKQLDMVDHGPLYDAAVAFVKAGVE